MGCRQGTTLYGKRRSSHQEAARGVALYVQCMFSTASAVPREGFVLEMHTDKADSTGFSGKTSTY